MHSRRDLITGRTAAAPPKPAPHLVSLVVHARPAELDAVRVALAAMLGVEIHGDSHTGKMVITLESADEHAMVAGMGAIGDLPGVLSTALVFQHCEA